MNDAVAFLTGQGIAEDAARKNLLILLDLAFSQVEHAQQNAA